MKHGPLSSISHALRLILSQRGDAIGRGALRVGRARR